MASRRNAQLDRKITDKDIVGLKHFDQLGQLLLQLHDVGCERDRAGNRALHMDQYCMLISLCTGHKPTLRTHEMICWYFCGMADEEDLLAHLR